MCRDGRITEKLESPCLAIEKEQKLIDIGNKIAPHAIWEKYDITNIKEVSKMLEKHSHKYDQIIANPPWELAYWVIYLSYQLLKINPSSYMIMLLPCDYFTSTKKRRDIFHEMNIHIVKEYLVCRWNYLEYDTKTAPRIGTDAIFVISIHKGITQPVMYETEWLFP